MFGWKYKVGLMLPSRNVVMEPDCYAWAPQGVSFHSARMRRDQNSSGVHDNRRMLDYAKEAAGLLRQAEVDLIVFGCTSASFVGGPGSDLALASELESLTETPVFTASTAVLEELEVMGCRRVSIITPYVEEINCHEEAFFLGNGYEVAAIHGMGIGVSTQVPRVTPEEIYHFTRAHVRPDSDAVFISCTNFRAQEARQWLQADLRIPVITSNLAIFHKIARQLHFADKPSLYCPPF